MLSLAVLDLTVFGLVIPASALVLAVLTGRGRRLRRSARQTVDKLDLAVVAALYLAVVALFRLAFPSSPLPTSWASSYASAPDLS